MASERDDDVEGAFCYEDALGDVLESKVFDVLGGMSDRFLSIIDDIDCVDDAVDIVLERFVEYTGGQPTDCQMEAIKSTCRFVVTTAGVQGGKTTVSADCFWTRIVEENIPGALYWLVAPDSIVGRTQRKRFEALAPEGWIVERRGAEHNRTWKLKNGASVEFRSAEKGERLVAATVHGIWVDEFAILKKGVWASSIRTRLTATDGWVVLSGTPAGRNWAYDEIWRPTIEGDDKRDKDFHGITWHSADNPAVSREEIESARRTMSEAYFKRNYEASWEAFIGQIYEGFSHEKHVVKNLTAPPSSVMMIGQDFGFRAPGAALSIARGPDWRYYILQELHEAGKLAEWWESEIAKMAEGHAARDVWCDPASPERIASLQKSTGLRALGSDNDVDKGIMKIATLFMQGRILIDDSCKHLIREIAGYRWGKGEKPVKENDHACDALRYGIMGDSMMSGLAGKAISRSGAGGYTR